MSQRPAATLVWMREEDDQLRGAAVSGESIAAISKRLCRSEKAIWHRARKIGIELRLAGGPLARNWTPEEDNRLRRLVEAGRSIEFVAAELKRSAKAVEGRAYALRISLKRVTLKPKAKGK